MNELGDLIKKNKSFFDKDEPDAGHFERFENKLLKMKQRKSLLQRSYQAVRIAAVVVLVVISSIWIFEKLYPNNNNKIALGEISQEYKEVEFYYTQLYQNKLDELNKVKTIDPELEAELIKNEFKELDSIYNTLQKELGNNKEDERIINAMIGYYQTKVELLNQIIHQLNDIKTEKSTTNSEDNKKSI